MVTSSGNIPSSFRDPSGFIFERHNILYRQINHSYQGSYELLMSSGLYEFLVEQSLLIPHEEVLNSISSGHNPYKVIRPRRVPFISYPYEWSFSQLKDAALTTIRIQKHAMDHGLSLKDASGYNIQFVDGRPVLIDTLSFEKYPKGKPWVAYSQFCRHFLAPLALMSHKDIRLGQLLTRFIDGIPLDLCASLLPARTKFSFSLLTHIHLHARSNTRNDDQPVELGTRSVSTQGLLGIIDSLETAVKRLVWRHGKTEWGDYYCDTNYSEAALESKKTIVSDFLDLASPGSVWDLGANNGLFSRLASERNISTIAFDIDPLAVEKNYLKACKDKASHILPLLLDLTNPSPAIGWGNAERDSLIGRGPADCVMALALIHHLAIGNNVPLGMISSFLHSITHGHLILEFVPKSDAQIKRLLVIREDVFGTYDQEHFERAFAQHFEIRSKFEIPQTERTMYLMKARS